ncbi:hypothetical protein GZH53_07340 [Flavihumibacter sp. R14]|nr:hypothetical protein [Flavihumibacter soli]
MKSLRLTAIDWSGGNNLRKHQAVNKMEVNYLLVIITTAIAFFVILFLTWKKRKHLRGYEKEQAKPEFNPEESRDEEQRF